MNSAPNHVTRNRSSASAIPRPTSGTSRRATPTGSRFLKAGSIPHAQAQKKLPNLHRKSWHPNDTAHFSSISLPTTRNSEPSPLPSPASLLQNASLPKSRTFGSLLASSREVTPSGRLMQPIQPPLPRSQTLGNISCFGQSPLTPSPRKPTQATSDVLRPYQYSRSQLDVSKMSKERRMTQKEMDLTKNIQREAAATRERMRNSTGKGSAVLKTPKPAKTVVSQVSASGGHSQTRQSSSESQVVRSNGRLSGANLAKQWASTTSDRNASESTDTGDLTPNSLLPQKDSWREESLNPKDVREYLCLPSSFPETELTKSYPGIPC